jgi:hypothetical protein
MPLLAGNCSFCRIPMLAISTMYCPARAIRRQRHYFTPFRGLILWGYAEYVGLIARLHRSSLDLTHDFSDQNVGKGAVRKIRGK